MRAGGGGNKTVLADNQLFDAVGRGHFDDLLNSNVIVKASVAADQKCFVIQFADGVENALHKVFNIIRLHGDPGFFPQAGRSHFLVVIGRGRNCFNHRSSFVV